MAYVTEIASGATVLDVADKELLALKTAGNADKAICINSSGNGIECVAKVSVAQGSANAGKALVVNASGNAVVTDLNTLTYNASEKTHSGSGSSISTSNGPIQTCSASSITLPTVVAGYTLTLLCTAATVTWFGNISWAGGEVPTFDTGTNVVTFIGSGSYWYGFYGGCCNPVA